MPAKMKRKGEPLAFRDMRERMELIGNGALAIARKHSAAKAADAPAEEPAKRIFLKPRKRI